jgi:HEPN domain-containing protein
MTHPPFGEAGAPNKRLGEGLRPTMIEFTRDPNHWLRRLSPQEWIRAALSELARAEIAWQKGQVRAGAVGVNRAAGMALNAVLIVEPADRWGRTYVEHLEALATDVSAPQAVRDACQRVLDSRSRSGDVVTLRTPRAHVLVIEAARDVIAHAWAIMKQHDASDD